MKTKKMIEFMKMGYIIIPKFFLKQYKTMNLNADEFLLLVYLVNEGGRVPLNINQLTNDMGLNNNDLLTLIHHLREKKLINVVVEKKDKKVIGEYLVVDAFYNKMGMMVIDYLNNDNMASETNNIYESFEKEFGRTLSPMEYEIIKTWLEKNIKEELIIGALKEAVYNGVSNLRYIDKILYEWGQQGFKTLQDVKKHHRKLQTPKTTKKEVFSYNWLEDDV
ncbi:MAG: DnaD domain-containing protein [Bacilli bacterium]|nr:DnaD domain protein [Bacilli bacterium]